MIRALILALLFAWSSIIAYTGDAVAAQRNVLTTSATSSEWVTFTPNVNVGIYIPVRVNGRATMALLYGGPSAIDTAFASSTGRKPNATGTVDDITVAVGNLTVYHTSAKADDLRSPANAQVFEKILGRPVQFRFGDALFNRLAVDIDYAHHRVAFRDPRTSATPPGAIAVPLIELHGERVVPLSIDRAPAASFELELGNVIGPLLVIPAYARAHHLLERHRISQRLSGRFTETVVTIDHLAFAGVDFPQTPIALVPESEVPPAPIAGGVGLPLLSKFRLIIDYSRNRLYAIPNATALRTSIPKDRIGMVLEKKNIAGGFGVAFVSPHSPAAVAGFKKGDHIALIDGKSFAGWAMKDIVKFQMTDAGTLHTFTMPDGSVRTVTAVDFF